jgi:hypothetical protein
VLRDFRNSSENQRSGHLPDDYPADLRKAARQGLLAGPFMYAYEVVKGQRKSALPAEKNSSITKDDLTAPALR